MIMMTIRTKVTRIIIRSMSMFNMLTIFAKDMKELVIMILMTLREKMITAFIRFILKLVIVVTHFVK